MKGFKKVLCLMMCAIIAISMVSCGDKSAKKGDDDIPTLIWYDRSATTKDSQLVNDAINEYIEPLIGCRVKRISIVGSEYNEKLRLVLAANEPVDIIFTGGSTYATYVKNGSFMEIDDLLDKYGKEIKEITPDYAIEAARIDGKLYGLTIYKDYAVEHVVYYDKAMAEKHGLDMQSAKTLADLEPMLEVIKQKEPEIYPFSFEPTVSGFEMLPYDDIMGTNIGGIDLEGNPNKIVNQYTTDKALEYYKLMHRWYNKGYMRKDIATVTNNNDISGRIFMSIQQELPYLVEQRNQTAEKEKAVVHLVEPTMGTKNVATQLFAIGANCKYPEKAMAFINLLNTDKHLRNLASYGIEGKHWVAVGEDFYKLPEGCSSKADTGFETYVAPQGNKYLSRMIEGTPEDIYEKYKEFDERAIKSPALGFKFDPENVQMEITALSNVYNEYIPSLITGAADPEVAFPKAVAKFKEAGIDVLIKEIQKQYDEWRKNQ